MQTATLAAGDTASLTGLIVGPAVDVTIAGTLDVAGLVLVDGGTVDVTGAITLAALELSDGGILTGPGTIDVTGTLNNTAIAIAGLGGTFQTLAIEAARFSNDGLLRADPYGVLQIAAPTLIDGLDAGTLAGGTYFANGGTILLAGPASGITTDDADIRLVIDPYVAAGMGNTPAIGAVDTGGATHDLAATLGTIAGGGTLFVEGMTYATSLALLDIGALQLQAAGLAASGLSITAGASLTGYGSVAGPILNDGYIVAGFPGDGDPAALVAALNTLSLAGDVTGTGTLAVGAALSAAPRAAFVLELGGAAAGPVVFDDHSGTLVLDSPARFGGTIEGFGVGAVGSSVVSNGIVLDGIDPSGASLSWVAGAAGGTLDVLEGASVAASLVFDGTYALADFRLGQACDLFGDPIADTVVVHAAVVFGAAAEAACFAQGTRIATVRGEVAVEALVAGDLVRTVSGRLAPVVWIGRRRVDCARHPRPEHVRPVEITAGALGGGLPRRTLLVSPEHALFLDGVLVPARALVNGDTIRQARAGVLTYFHVELPRHDVLFAEGAGAESYLDTGNRAMFVNAGLAPETPVPSEPCAPFVESGPVLDAIRARQRRPAGTAMERRVALLRRAGR